MLVEQVEQWIGTDVVDPEGYAVGKLTEVYYRGADPVLIGARGGRLSRKRILIPLEGASVARDYLRIAFPADRLVQTKSSDDELNAEDLAAVADHYGAAHTAMPDELEGSKAR
ncbi:MAG: uncharacterized protein JWM31_2768, partial [Solirubrobacterales bacterium]|nr:uncharacterized protein [Solirubrobacterales bacterium]